ncbi:MAG: hypothetical protein KDA44_12985 [Planctomycetales bacterium]|nr:hypothetical protein [Planctomycetales bacterium]
MGPHAVAERLLPRTRAALAGVMLLSVAAAVARGEVFVIKVVDSETGRGVPLVELTPQGGPLLVTDSNGIVAVDDPALLNTNKFWGFRSYGYSEYGSSIQTTPGGMRQLAIDRRNLAERLYRVTGPEIYGESVAAGIASPIANPLHNANVRGQDSVQTAIYHDQIHWFWGDTLYEVGFGNFRTAGATSQMPGQGGLDPAVGVDLTYFENSAGSARQMMPLSDPGPIWIDGLFTVADAGGQQRMLTRYSRIEPGSADFNVLEQGLALYDDATVTFQRFQNYDLTAPITPQGHALRHSVAGNDYLYFTQSYPNVRVRADWEHVTDIAQWEAFTPLLPGTRYDAANPSLEYDEHGKLVFDWKQGADPLSREMLNDLLQSGKLARDDSPFRLEDAATGRAIDLHRASVKWNEFRQSWVMIGVEAFGDSFLGEVWFAEAPTPEGPWNKAVKVASHDRGASSDYTFYNPELHEFFNEDGGRVIYFEGTYSNTFSGNSVQTPLYDYNQMMYRLDLSTIPRLAPLRADFDADGDVDGGDFLAWQREYGSALNAPGAGADGDRSGVVDRYDLELWQAGLGMTGGLVGGVASASAVAVAEPVSVELLVLGAFWGAVHVSRLNAGRNRAWA